MSKRVNAKKLTASDKEFKLIMKLDEIDRERKELERKRQLLIEERKKKEIWSVGLAVFETDTKIKINSFSVRASNYEEAEGKALAHARKLYPWPYHGHYVEVNNSPPVG